MSQLPQKYNRVLVKLSGEALMGEGAYGLDMSTVNRIVSDITEVVQAGIQLSIVVGGGNIFRGLSGAASGMDRAKADYMGMLATVMNALAVQNALENSGVSSKVLSAIPMPTVCEPFARQTALDYLEKGTVVVFAAGTGNPYFTTDTAAVLRAIETNSDIIVKATQVDGVYTADPKKDPTATRYEELTYKEVLAKDLQVMDGAAVALARDNDLPVLVFSIWQKGNLLKALTGQGDYTIVRN